MIRDMYIYIYICISHIIGMLEMYIHTYVYYIYIYILMQQLWVHVINWRSLADLQWLISKFQKFQILLVREMRMKLHFLESSLCQWLHSVTRHYTVRTCPEKNRASKGKLSPYNPKRFRCKKPEKIIPPSVSGSMASQPLPMDVLVYYGPLIKNVTFWGVATVAIAIHFPDRV